MHELSICSSIAAIAARHAAGQPVAVISVRAGQLRQIVPDTLVYCWELVSAGTPLAGSRLEVETVPVRIRCQACGQVTQIGGVPSFRCGDCGAADVTITDGDEFLVTSLEFAGAVGGTGVTAGLAEGTGA